MIFLAPRTFVDPTVRGPGYPLAPSSDLGYSGQGVSLGHFEGSKPQKNGGLRVD